MPDITLTPENLKALRWTVKQDFPDVSLSHIGEATAAALGFRNNSALSAAMKEGETTRVLPLDAEAFSDRFKDVTGKSTHGFNVPQILDVACSKVFPDAVEWPSVEDRVFFYKLLALYWVDGASWISSVNIIYKEALKGGEDMAALADMSRRIYGNLMFGDSMCKACMGVIPPFDYICMKSIDTILKNRDSDSAYVNNSEVASVLNGIEGQIRSISSTRAADYSYDEVYVFDHYLTIMMKYNISYRDSVNLIGLFTKSLFKDLPDDVTKALSRATLLRLIAAGLSSSLSFLSIMDLTRDLSEYYSDKSKFLNCLKDMVNEIIIKMNSGASMGECLRPIFTHREWMMFGPTLDLRPHSFNLNEIALLIEKEYT